MKNGLYHKEVWMPKIKVVDEELELTPTRHSQARGVELPRTINLSKTEIIELEIQDNQIVKVLVRTPLNRYNHLVMAIALPNCVVKTAWVNDKNDYHATLDKGKYISR